MAAMSGRLAVHDIEVPTFQRREWALERVWWVLLGLLLVAAMLGLFSSGPLSETTAGSADSGVEVKYERFVRNTGKAAWTIRLAPTAVQNQKASLFISNTLAEAMATQNIAPAPATETSTRGGLLLEWDVARPDSPPLVHLRFRPDAIGPVDGLVRAVDGAEVPISLFAYP